MLREQDQGLEELGTAVDRVGRMADAMNQELNAQNRMLGELEVDVENTSEQMNFVMGKLSKLLKTKGKRTQKRSQKGVLSSFYLRTHSGTHTPTYTHTRNRQIPTMAHHLLDDRAHRLDRPHRLCVNHHFLRPYPAGAKQEKKKKRVQCIFKMLSYFFSLAR